MSALVFLGSCFLVLQCRRGGATVPRGAASRRWCGVQEGMLGLCQQTARDAQIPGGGLASYQLSLVCTGRVCTAGLHGLHGLHGPHPGAARQQLPVHLGTCLNRMLEGWQGLLQC